MMNAAVAKRYGQALLQIGQEKNSIDRYQEDLKLVVDTIENSAELKDVLTSQTVSIDEKKNIVKQIFADKVDAMVLNLLFVVVDKNREESIADIYSVFCALADEVRNIAYADVVSAYPLTEEQETALSAQLAKLSGKTVKLNVSVDASLLAGMVVTFGDKVYDGTVGARLAGMKNKLHEVQF
ncbi:MAG: F0F1 ATP synthase subunit delta [Peptococcaceae bacterium]|nr:F0F1 ATP synthase subunit delta [Peptococcaceae bacterium]MBO5115269.1 F0F1 ATP synthase subunit delta [Peptococcaceae bacterium]MBO5140438.1 F0F1 ATP synthase subunit delta [Peptococcaceae bacterium]MBO5429378.1 F0F1 ATP synthase subunit delta [Peptococcaceae bacterium]